MNTIKYLTLVLATGLCLFVFGCNGQGESWPEIIDSPASRTILPPKPIYSPPQLQPHIKNLRNRTIIVDAGHGGSDPGAGQVGYSRVPEKTIVLAIAQNIRQQLANAGARVIMTRTGDYFVELDSRAAMAERYKADLLLSIHADSNPQSYISGPTAYIAKNASYKSRKIANSINSSFKRAGITPLGVREENFRVLVKHSRPAVLVECGFLTNRAEANKLNNNWYRKKIATVITNGVIKALGSK